MYNTIIRINISHSVDELNRICEFYKLSKEVTFYVEQYKSTNVECIWVDIAKYQTPIVATREYGADIIYNTYYGDFYQDKDIEKINYVNIPRLIEKCKVKRECSILNLDNIISINMLSKTLEEDIKKLNIPIDFTLNTQHINSHKIWYDVVNEKIIASERYHIQPNYDIDLSYSDIGHLLIMESSNTEKTSISEKDIIRVRIMNSTYEDILILSNAFNIKLFEFYDNLKENEVEDVWLNVKTDDMVAYLEKGSGSVISINNSNQDLSYSDVKKLLNMKTIYTIENIDINREDTRLTETEKNMINYLLIVEYDVDEILDKITAFGIESLSNEELNYLNKQSINY